MCLVDEGRLKLDEPVTTYLPWLTLSEPGAAEHVTVCMLLCHRSGLPFVHQSFGPRDGAALATRMRQQVPELPLVAPPGTIFSYSNVGIQVLAHLAEVVTGTFYADLMQERIFGPLEMGRTTFDPTVAMTYPLAQSHAMNDDQTLTVEHRFLDNASQDLSGRAFSTVLDVANFAIMHLHQGSFRDKVILSPGAVQEMHTIQTDSNLAPGMSYGFTFGISRSHGKRVVGHAGQISNFRARCALVPESKIAVITVCNGGSQSPITETIVDLVLDQLL